MSEAYQLPDFLEFVFLLTALNRWAKRRLIIKNRQKI